MKNSYNILQKFVNENSIDFDNFYVISMNENNITLQGKMCNLKNLIKLGEFKSNDGGFIELELEYNSIIIKIILT